MTDRPLTVGVIGTGAAVMSALAGARHATIRDPLTLAPALTGPCSHAWLCDAGAQRRAHDVPLDADATVAHYLVEAPWAHPAWHSYSVLLIHLRPMPGIEAPRMFLAGATHELWVHALDPAQPRMPVITGTVPAGTAFPWLHPINFAAQFIAPSDALALQRIDRAVQEICDGRLSPDTDFRYAWAARFGDNMLKDRA